MSSKWTCASLPAMAALVLTGCSTMGIRVHGYMRLPGAVEHVAAVEQESGAPILVQLRNTRANSLDLIVRNASAEDVRVLWDASSIAVAGRSYRVVSGATRVRDSQLAQPAMVLQPGTEAQVVIVAPELAGLPVVTAGQEIGLLRLRVATEGSETSTSIHLVARDIPLSRPIHYDEIHRVQVGSVHVALCVLTGIFYGGWCWAYLAMPFDSQLWEARRQAQAQIEARYGAPPANLDALQAYQLSW